MNLRTEVIYSEDNLAYIEKNGRDVGSKFPGNQGYSEHR
jgi:hypothetical protein